MRLNQQQLHYSHLGSSRDFIPRGGASCQQDGNSLALISVNCMCTTGSRGLTHTQVCRGPVRGGGLGSVLCNNQSDVRPPHLKWTAMTSRPTPLEDPSLMMMMMVVVALIESLPVCVYSWGVEIDGV